MNNMKVFLKKPLNLIISLYRYYINFSGPIYCAIYWSSLSSCLHGISQSKWHRRSFFCEGDGLPRSPKFSGNIWGRAGHVCKKRVAERGMYEF